MAIRAEFLQAAIKARASRPPQSRQRLQSHSHAGLTVSAAFDSGNVARVETRGDNEYVIHARADCEGTPHATRSRTWFCFSVKGAEPGRTLSFEVRMSNQQKLFDHGMRPVYRSLPSKPAWARLPTATPCTVDGATTESFAIHITHTVEPPAESILFFAFCFPLGYADQMARLAWADALFRQPTARLAPEDAPSGWAAAVDLHSSPGPDASVVQATAGTTDGAAAPPPVSAEQMREYRKARLVEAAKRAALAASVSFHAAEHPADAAAAKEAVHHHMGIAEAAAALTAGLLPAERSDDSSRGIYYRRELLTRSLQGRRIDLLTITGSSGQLSALEPPLPPPLLPEGLDGRPHRFKKKRTILITGRVHPGETPASHVMDGLLSFLLRPDDPRACALRERFVFKLIPMLNPDGVTQGHYRGDSKGCDLNRKYSSPDPEHHPSIYACLEVAKQCHASGELFAYIDTHAHAGRRGCFFYGNRMQEQKDADDSALYARLVALNTRWFDFDGCTWFGSEAHGGSARAAIFAATQNPLVFTLECNYDSGLAPNQLPPRHGTSVTSGRNRGEASVECGRLSPEPAAERLLSPKYTPECWQEIGKALAVAALDFVDANPYSRLGAPGGDGLRKMRAAVVAAQQQKAERKAQQPAKSAKGGLILGTVERWGDDDEDDDGGDDDEEELGVIGPEPVT